MQRLDARRPSMPGPGHGERIVPHARRIENLAVYQRRVFAIRQILTPTVSRAGRHKLEA